MTPPVTTDASVEEGPGRSTFVALAGVALSLLLYEILLTRVSSLRYHFHFSYLVVSNCLLMFGASGTVLALSRSTWWPAPKSWLSRLALAQAGSLGLAWAVVLGCGPGLWSWAVVLGCGAGLRCWAVVLCCGPGLWS